MLSSFLRVKSNVSVSILRSLPTSEKTTSPSGSFLIISDNLFEFTKQSPSRSTSTETLDLIVMSKSEPINSTKSSITRIYKPDMAGVEGRGLTTLETEETASLSSFVFVLNFTFYPLYI